MSIYYDGKQQQNNLPFFLVESGWFCISKQLHLCPVRFRVGGTNKNIYGKVTLIFYKRFSDLFPRYVMSWEWNLLRCECACTNPRPNGSKKGLENIAYGMILQFLANTFFISDIDRKDLQGKAQPEKSSIWLGFFGLLTFFPRSKST